MAEIPKDKPIRRHMNQAQKQALRAADAGLFVQRYGRKAQKGWEPNDRSYSRDFEKTAKTMRPEDLDRLMRDDEE